MLFDMLTRIDKKDYSFKETYDFPVKTIKGATKHAEKLINDYNSVEIMRYGETAFTRTLLGVTFHKEGK